MTREDPPRLLIASDDEVLSRAIATRVIAGEDPNTFSNQELERLRSALLREQWGDAVAIWIGTTSASVDVYPDEEVLTEEDLGEEETAFSIRMSPLFDDRPDSR